MAASTLIPMSESGHPISRDTYRTCGGQLASASAASAPTPARRLGKSADGMGFTLIEMLVTVSVLAIILAVAIPSFAPSIRNSRVFALQTEVMSSLALARSEAAKRGVLVGVQASASAPSGNEWGNGWTVWADSNGNGAIDAGEPVLRKHEPIPTGFTLGVKNVPSAGVIEFDSHGFLSPPVAGVQINLCATVSGSPGYQITVQPNGMADSASATCP